MSLLADLVAFYVTVPIKISVLRSWESHRLNQAHRRIRFFNPAATGLGYPDTQRRRYYRLVFQPPVRFLRLLVIVFSGVPRQSAQAAARELLRV